MVIHFCSNQAYSASKWAKAQSALFLACVGTVVLSLVGCTQPIHRTTYAPHSPQMMVGANSVPVSSASMTAWPSASTGPIAYQAGYTTSAAIPTFSSSPLYGTFAMGAATAPIAALPSHPMPASGSIAAATPRPEPAHPTRAVPQQAQAPQPIPAQAAPQAMPKKAVAASTPKDNPIPMTAIPPQAPASNPLAAATPKPPAKPLPQPIAQPMAPASPPAIASDPLAIAKPIPPIAATQKAMPPANPIPNELPAIPPIANNRRPEPKETSLAWAPWPFTAKSPESVSKPDPIAGARGLIPYRGATLPGSKAAKAFRDRMASNTAVASSASSGLTNGIAPLARPGLQFRGGRTLQDLAFVNLYIGGEDRWKQSDVLAIDKAISAAMADEQLNKPLLQYFHGKPIKSVALPSHPLVGTVAEKLTRADVHQTLRSLHAQGYLDDYDLDHTVFNVLCPPGVILSDETPEVDSTAGLAGYHGSVPSEMESILYTVVVSSELLPDGRQNGIPAFQQSWKNTAAILYHQLQEVRTNPDAEDALRNAGDPDGAGKLGWTADSGDELGDLALKDGTPLTEIFREVPLTNGSGTVPVQILLQEQPAAPVLSPIGDLPPIDGNLFSKP
ncbi:hypothetical protein [Planctomicrobium sp. SH527]|uniref:hypothetical protein n=1 Tax=Planctomicrobium sp. SH527 TaxID=3448123 RepID=UPI003F5B0A79